MAPVLDQLRKEYAGKLQVDFIDVHKHQEAAETYGIRAIPTQVLFDASGKEVFRHEGFFPKDDILAKWAELGVDLSAAWVRRVRRPAIRAAGLRPRFGFHAVDPGHGGMHGDPQGVRQGRGGPGVGLTRGVRAGLRLPGGPGRRRGADVRPGSLLLREAAVLGLHELPRHRAPGLRQGGRLLRRHGRRQGGRHEVPPEEQRPAGLGPRGGLLGELRRREGRHAERAGRGRPRPRRGAPGREGLHPRLHPLPAPGLHRHRGQRAMAPDTRLLRGLLPPGPPGRRPARRVVVREGPHAGNLCRTARPPARGGQPGDASPAPAGKEE